MVSRTCGLEKRSISVCLYPSRSTPGTGARVGRGLVVHVAEEEGPEQRVLGGLVHQPVAGQVGEVGHGLVAAVEQPQLHQLVGLHLVDELHPDLLVRRPPGRERVLEHPLRVGLADDRPPVLDPEPLPDLGPVGVGGHRGDAVDHGVGEAHLALDPVAEFRVPQPGEGGEHPPGQVAVALQVVAGHDRERRQAALPAAPQRLGDQAERGPRNRAGLQVVRSRPGWPRRTRRSRR